MENTEFGVSDKNRLHRIRLAYDYAEEYGVKCEHDYEEKEKYNGKTNDL